MYGLTKKEFYKIIEVLKYYSKEIEWVKIFGSRARGDYKKTSDIDLAIKFRKDRLLYLKDDLYKTSLPYTTDIIDYSKNTNENLKDFIDREGYMIFITDERGKIIMNQNKLKLKLENLKKALGRLEDSLKKDPHEDDLYLDGIIQRFEFVFELSWKLMKGYLEYDGIEVNSPRGAFRESFKVELIEDGTAWIKMMENRNRTSHTYNQDTAWEIYNKVKIEYIILFQEFFKIIDKKIKFDNEL